jgi:hypothetical protein
VTFHGVHRAGVAGTPEAKEIYKEIYKDRASTAECVNAISRNRGLRQFLVRGLRKVRTLVLWFAIAHNLMLAVPLRAEAALVVRLKGRKRRKTGRLARIGAMINGKIPGHRTGRGQ